MVKRVIVTWTFKDDELIDHSLFLRELLSRADANSITSMIIGVGDSTIELEDEADIIENDEE